MCSAGEGSCGVVILLLIPERNGFVGWEPHSGRKQSCYLRTIVWCEPLLNRVHQWCVV